MCTKFLHSLPLTLALTLISCQNNSQSSVPDYPVRIDIDITAEYPHFIPENGFQTMTFTKKRYAEEYIGYGGVLVWVNVTCEYCAADMVCPKCLLPSKPVVVDGLFANCPTCGEAFDLSTAAFPTKGIVNQPLKRYNTRARSTVKGIVLEVRN